MPNSNITWSVPLLVILVFIANLAIIADSEPEMSYCKDVRWDHIVDSSQYSDMGHTWNTYTIKNSGINSFCIIMKMDKDIDNFKFVWMKDKNEYTNLVFYKNDKNLDYCTSYNWSSGPSCNVKQGDELKWVFNIMSTEIEDGQAWIAFEPSDSLDNINRYNGVQPEGSTIAEDSEDGQELNKSLPLSVVKSKKGQLSDIAKEQKLTNQIPTDIELFANLPSPQYVGTQIVWTATASDAEKDPLLFRFLLRGIPVTEWTDKNTWMWDISEANLGFNIIEVQVRDAHHADPDSFDDNAIAQFNVSMIVHYNDDLARYINLAQDKHVESVLIQNGTYLVSEGIIIDKWPLKLSGTSKDGVMIYPGISVSNKCLNENFIDIKHSGCTIANLSIYGFNESLNIGSDNCEILNTHISSNNTSINIYKCNNTNIKGNIIDQPNESDHHEAAIEINHSKFITIYNNSLLRTNYAIVLQNASCVNITYNQVESNQTCINTYISSNNQIMHNEIEGYSKSIILGSQTNNTLITNNNISGEPIDYNYFVNNWTGNYWPESPMGIKFKNIQSGSLSGSRVNARDDHPLFQRFS